MCPIYGLQIYDFRTMQNCLDALDGTYMKVNMSVIDRLRYRTRKGEVPMNVLDICDTKGILCSS